MMELKWPELMALDSTGDHLVIRYGVYTHHGINLGNGTVIHYGRGLQSKAEAKVEIVDLEIFARGYTITRNPDPSNYSADEIVQRAKSRLDENNYDLFENNCEHFVNWCRHGVANSPQINRAESVCRRGSAAAAKLVFPKFASRFAVKKAASRMGVPFGLPAALAGDAVQLSAELVAIRCGKDKHTTRNIGRRSGALASSSIGYMLAGPAGAAVGLSSWLFGEMVGHTAVLTTRQAAGKMPSCESGER